MKGRRKRLKPEKPIHQKGFNRQIWKVVDGAIRDAFIHHQDYLTAKGIRGASARRSVAKRVTGAMLSYLEQSGLSGSKCPRWGRSGKRPASVKGE
jgi:hypothetical protein